MMDHLDVTFHTLCSEALCVLFSNLSGSRSFSGKDVIRMHPEGLSTAMHGTKAISNYCYVFVPWIMIVDCSRLTVNDSVKAQEKTG